MAGGATRSALTQHQALQNNLADVSAKDSSQVNSKILITNFFLYNLTINSNLLKETLVNLVALIFNLVLFVYLKDSKLYVFLRLKTIFFK